MSDLGIYFSEDVTSRLLALAQANERALTLAQRYGMDREAANLCKAIYTGALADVGRAFGLTIPNRKGVSAYARTDGRTDDLLELPIATTAGGVGAADASYGRDGADANHKRREVGKSG